MLIKILHQYLKDGLKEVRIGVIKHLHDFCGVVGSKERQQFLKVYSEALQDPGMIDVFAEHIGDFALLYDSKDVTQHLLPIFFKLCESKLAHVRKLAGHNLSKILDVYAEDNEKQTEIIRRVLKDFCMSRVYYQRQVFVYMAASVMNANKALFEKYLKTNFCNLAKDRVCNVRIIVSKAIGDHMKGSGHFLFDPEVNRALYNLKNDKDSNVLEHIDDISVVCNPESFAKMELDDQNTNSSDLIEEAKTQTKSTDFNETNENLLDFEENEEHKESTNTADELSDIIFTSNTSENVKKEELIEFEKPKEDSKVESNNLLDIQDENVEQTESSTLIPNSLDSINKKEEIAENLIEQIVSNSPEDSNLNDTDLIDLNEAPQESKVDEQLI